MRYRIVLCNYQYVLVWIWVLTCLRSSTDGRSLLYGSAYCLNGLDGEDGLAYLRLFTHVNTRKQ